MPPTSDLLTLRRSVLAACVLHDIDTTPGEDGIVLDVGSRAVALSWDAVAELAAPAAGDGELVAALLARRLRALSRLDHPDRLQARLLALPAGHADHAGPDWVRARVPGGVLDMGLGLVLDETDEPLPLPPVAVPSGLVPPATVAGWWEQALAHGTRMGALLVERLRSGRPTVAGSSSGAVLRPYGGTDVLALLSLRGVREYLAREDGSGMRAVAAPARSRGWLDPSRVDPAFVAAAWTATDPLARGVPVPLLVTADEVGAARALGDVVAQSLDQPRAWRAGPWGGPRR
ncbi:MAG: hypothetical protein U0Q15_18455 [Kineosporiaceae bacterium]